MKTLPERIMEHAEAMPEATPICPAALLHLGQRPAVNQALSRLARSGRLLRICHGVYMRPIETRFGPCPPSIEKSLQSLSALWGETIVPNGGSAANWLGPEEVEEGLDAVLPKLSGEDLEELAAARAVMPRWLAEPLSTRLAHRGGRVSA